MFLNHLQPDELELFLKFASLVTAVDKPMVKSINYESSEIPATWITTELIEKIDSTCSPIYTSYNLQRFGFDENGLIKDMSEITTVR